MKLFSLGCGLSTTSCDQLWSDRTILGVVAAREGKMSSKIHSLHPAFQIGTVTQVSCGLDGKIACFLRPEEFLCLSGEASLLSGTSPESAGAFSRPAEVTSLMISHCTILLLAATHGKRIRYILTWVSIRCSIYCHCVVVSDWNLIRYLPNWIVGLKICLYLPLHGIPPCASKQEVS